MIIGVGGGIKSEGRFNSSVEFEVFLGVIGVSFNAFGMMCGLSSSLVVVSLHCL